jgi:hypothetical protein
MTPYEPFFNSSGCLMLQLAFSGAKLLATPPDPGTTTE